MLSPLCSLVFIVSKGVVKAEIRLPAINAGITLAYNIFLSPLRVLYYYPIRKFRIF